MVDRESCNRPAPPCAPTSNTRTQRLPFRLATVPARLLLTTALSLETTTVQLPTVDSVPMLNPTFSGAFSPSEVTVAVTMPVALVNTLCVWAPLTVSCR